MIRERLGGLEAVEAALETAREGEREALENRRRELLSTFETLTAEEKIILSRLPRRPKTVQFIDALFTDFFAQRGDRQCREDTSILGGIALFHGRPVTVIGHRKGTTIEENMACNFGMPGPEGYRKAQRLMKQAEKFGRPIITFLDTPGAYPGMQAEERGQGEAIASSLALMSRLRVPVICVITGEGNSGGALALGLGDRVLMLENAYYSVVSPEACATILWKDAKKRGEAGEALKLTAQDLERFGVIDGIIPEALGGAQRDPKALYAALDKALCACLDELCMLSGDELIAARYQKYRTIGLA